MEVARGCVRKWILEMSRGHCIDAARGFFVHLSGPPRGSPVSPPRPPPWSPVSRTVTFTSSSYSFSRIVVSYVLDGNERLFDIFTRGQCKAKTPCKQGERAQYPIQFHWSRVPCAPGPRRGFVLCLVYVLFIHDIVASFGR